MFSIKTLWEFQGQRCQNEYEFFSIDNSISTKNDINICSIYVYM